MNNIAISIDNLSFAYDRKQALSNLTIEVSQNRICFVMGNNGSGKTTLLKNILGLLTPQSGSIEILGKDIRSLDHLSMSRLVSYVPQAIRLNTDFKVIDYLALGRTPHIGILKKLSEADYEIIDKYTIQFGINDYIDSEFNSLSGGQKQLVAIVRSLIQDTPIIVLDEPMSALDIGKQAELLRAFRDLAKYKTIIMTTHNPNHALSIDCDVCVLNHGKTLAFGKNNKVVNEALLNEVYGPYISLARGNSEHIVFNLNP